MTRFTTLLLLEQDNSSLIYKNKNTCWQNMYDILVSLSKNEGKPINLFLLVENDLSSHVIYFSFF